MSWGLLQRRLLRGGVALGICLAGSLAEARQGAQEKESCQTYIKHSVPRFRVAKKYRTELKPGLVLFVSVASEDFKQDDLIALGCLLGKTNSKEEALYAWIFDSDHAASHYHPPGEGNDRQTNLAHRALYGFSRQKGEEGQSLDWWPEPLDRSRTIHINLGAPPSRGPHGSN